MISDVANKKKFGFTLIESVMTIAILAVTMATMATMLRYSDNAATQARLEATALLEFSKQCNWLVNVPMTSFKDSITTYMADRGASWPLAGVNAVTVTTNSAVGYSCGLLYEPPTGTYYPPRYYLMRSGTLGAFPYTITLSLDKASPTNAYTTVDAIDAFTVNVSMVYAPPTLLNQTPGTGSPTKTFNFSFDKW